MFKIRVERLVQKDIQTVFEALADHENYKRFPGIDMSELLEEGNEEKNGLNALRRVGAGSFKVRERITRFERPHRMDYRILKAQPLPMRHDRGEITLQEDGDFTRVIWISEGHITVPLLGNIVDKAMQRQGSAMFNAMLKSIERR